MSAVADFPETDPLAATLPGRLQLWAEVRSDAVALREKDLGVWREITWREYAGEVAAAARALHELGVERGDGVAILSDNRTEWLYADLGAQAIGARSVGVYQTNPPEDVAYAVAHSDSVVLFCEDQEQVDKAVDCRADTPNVRHVVVFDPRGTRGYDDDRLLSWEDFIARGRAALAADPTWFRTQLAARDPADPAMVIYTSGTTGPPKGALLSSANAVESALAVTPMTSAGPGDSVLSYLPLCHVAEKIFSLFLPLASGAVVHFGESIETVRSDLAEVSPTIFLGVPRIWEKMHASATLKMRDSSWLKRTLFRIFTARGGAIAERRREGSSGLGQRLWDAVVWALGDALVYRPLQERLGMRRCRFPISGAAPIAPEILRWFNGVGVPVCEGYGMTESSGVSHLNLPSANHIGTVGQQAPMVTTRIADDGEICVRGPMVFAGYLKNPEATAAAISADGWLHTGDIGALDADGYLSITGRKKEIIITAGGKNLSPEKIENALKTSPYLKEVVAVGDARKFIGALVQIDYDAVGDWATRRGLGYTSYADLAAKPEVVALVKAEVATANAHLARVESVREVRILPKELHQDDGELTATQKVRRRAVYTAFASLIADIYGDAPPSAQAVS